MDKDSHRYDDMLDLPHHQSIKHPPMSALARAAQFSPYDALTGYSDQITESARLTHRKIGLSESDQEVLNEKLQIVDAHIDDLPRPLITATFFEPDSHKEGGAYCSYSGNVKNIDLLEQKLIFFARNGISAGKSIALGELWNLEGDIFQEDGLPNHSDQEADGL